MAYTTAFQDTSSNTDRSTRDKWASEETTIVPQLQTTAYWIAQGKEGTTQAWTFSTAEPTNV
jgi:hypothetical protein